MYKLAKDKNLNPVTMKQKRITNFLSKCLTRSTQSRKVTKMNHKTGALSRTKPVASLRTTQKMSTAMMMRTRKKSLKSRKTKKNMTTKNRKTIKSMMEKTKKDRKTSRTKVTKTQKINTN